MKYLRRFEENFGPAEIGDIYANYMNLVNSIRDNMKRLGFNKIDFDPKSKFQPHHEVSYQEYQGPGGTVTFYSLPIKKIIMDDLDQDCLLVVVHNDVAWHYNNDKPYDYEVEVWDLIEDELQEIIDYIENMTPEQIEEQRIRNEADKFGI